jgi:hypothetical protein
VETKRGAGRQMENNHEKRGGSEDDRRGLPSSSYHPGERACSWVPTANATAIVAASAGAQSMKPPKLITWGIAWSAADTTAGHRLSVRTLARGASESTTKPSAMT